MILTGYDLMCRHVTRVRQGDQPILDPWVGEKARHDSGASYGLCEAGYDVRTKQAIDLEPGGFMLVSTVERFNMPRDLLARVSDKSTYARMGLSVFNTTIEPGWSGWLTVELKNQSPVTRIQIPAGGPIAQILFHKLTGNATPYNGKYQNQPDRPVEAIMERAA